MKHTIQFPNGRFEDELRTIVWDDEAGTVEGDHDLVPTLQLVCESDAPCVISRQWGVLHLDDVAHNPQHFLSALCGGHQEGRVPPAAVLPDALKGIEPLFPEAPPESEPLPPGASY